MTMNELYYQAIAADDAFEAAIKAQHGPRASRWDHATSHDNKSTRAARAAKYAADTAWRDYLHGLEVDDTPAWRAEFCRQIDEELAN